MEYMIVKSQDDTTLYYAGMREYSGKKVTLESCVKYDVKEISVILIESNGKTMKFDNENFYERNKKGEFLKTANVGEVSFPTDDEFFRFLEKIRKGLGVHQPIIRGK